MARHKGPKASPKHCPVCGGELNPGERLNHQNFCPRCVAGLKVINANRAAADRYDRLMARRRAVAGARVYSVHE